VEAAVAALAEVKTLREALDRLAQLDGELAPFEQFVINAASGLISAIESAAEIQRGK
jgi:hypothetical protein